MAWDIFIPSLLWAVVCWSVFMVDPSQPDMCASLVIMGVICQVLWTDMGLTAVWRSDWPAILGK